MAKLSEAPTLKQHADDIVAPEFRQPLKTIRGALGAIGWPNVDHPKCCGVPVKVMSCIGPYFAECQQCGRFIADVSGPMFSESGSSVQFIDRDKFADDTDWDRCWIAGRKALEDEGGDV